MKILRSINLNLKPKLNMNYKIVKRTIFAGALLALSLITAPLAMAQVTSQAFVTVTNQPAIVTTTASSNIICWIPLFNASEVAIEWRFNQTSASTSNATLNVRASVDGTNVCTDTFAAITRASTGTTDVRAFTNWNHQQLASLKALIVYSIDNSTALTSLTNKSILVRRVPQ